MKYIVTTKHETEFPNPIVLAKGEQVIVGQDPNPEVNPDTWVNWVYCIKADGSNEGFVPSQIIEQENDKGIVLEDYTANELNADKGIVLLGMKELNGWLWAENTTTGELGWIPLENIEKQ